MKSEYSFKYCCDKSFKKYYSKYMSEIRREFGKKNMKNLIINVQEEPSAAKYHLTINSNRFSIYGNWKEDCICKKCFQELLKYPPKRKLELNKIDFPVNICYITVQDGV